MCTVRLAFLVRFQYVKIDFREVHIKESSVGTTSLDFLFVSLSDVLFKFIHALIL